MLGRLFDYILIPGPLPQFQMENYMVPSGAGTLLAKISRCNVSKRKHVCSIVVHLKLSIFQQISLKFIFDVEIKKTQVSLSAHHEQCQVVCLPILFLDI